MPGSSLLATCRRWWRPQADHGPDRTNKYIEAEEIAVIVPVPEDADDADYDIWGEARPHIVAAFNKVTFQAVVYGTNIPVLSTTWVGTAWWPSPPTRAT